MTTAEALADEGVASPSDDRLIFSGTVVERHRGDTYLVACRAGALRRTVIAQRLGNRALRAGERVDVEVLPYDMTHGRIIERAAQQ